MNLCFVDEKCRLRVWSSIYRMQSLTCVSRSFSLCGMDDASSGANNAGASGTLIMICSSRNRASDGTGAMVQNQHTECEHRCAGHHVRTTMHQVAHMAAVG